MPYGLYVSAAGANAQSHRLDVLSHNLANVNTPGFKPHLSILKARHSAGIENGETYAGNGGIDDLGGGIAIQPTVTQFSQGPIRATGVETDFALNGDDSFFVVNREGQQMLTRAGNFIFNAQGQLVTESGDTVMSTGGSSITIDTTQPYRVTPDGAIEQGGAKQYLMIGKPQAIGDLSRVGDNLYRPLGSVDPVPPEARKIVNGHLEQSAIQPTAAMMELIEASRAYEANVRMIQNQDSVLGTLIGRVLRE
jgi:flagellar basal-body rod protein FlgF